MRKIAFTIELPKEQFRPRSGVKPSQVITDKRQKNKNWRKAKHKKNIDA
jgi:hypothetical protein